MRKDRNEAAATTAAVAADVDKTSIAPQESISENEESDTITDHSSSMSEHRKRHIGAATQFSVQRSDTDCLRMRISAIRPTVSANTELKRKSSTHKSASEKAATTKMLVDKANNNTVDASKIKLSQHNKKQTTSSNALVRSGRERSVPIDSKTLTMSLAQSAPCLSDATESGCSEATTTTIAAAIGKSTKKVKVKRKKAPVKSNETKHKSNKKSHLPPAANAVFSSDSDDEPLQKLQQQRAPRLLITAINSKNTQLKTSLVSSADKIGLSSSDNELPDLVSAAIKRVESDTEDTGGECSNKLSSKTKHLPQYQSTLLQDFMEKTQMLGQTSIMTPTKNIATTDPIPATSITPTTIKLSNQEPTPNPSAKKRRGRPRKIVSAQTTTETDATAVTAGVTASTTTINESADSGVISTTSTAQSTSPSPRLSCAVTKSESCSSPTKSATEVGTNSKPKIDFVNLDKRMYATERVLYPPPRNKRRQSSSVVAFQQQLDKKSSAGIISAASKLAKEELQLDPVWRKIDVNKKFRRPSVSGYKSDGGGGNTTICSKILAAQSGYVSDYGSAHPRSHHHSTHNSGYKSDASGKSRFSTRSCSSTRRSRAKSCGYRSDCKEGDKAVMKSNKFRRKRRMSSLMRHHSKSVGNLNDEHDILQLAGLSLGQSSEESNEYVCKPSLKCLPTTSVSKKYGEINRFVATGEYFGRGAAGSSSKRLFEDVGSQDGFRNFSGKLNLLRKNSLGSELAADMLSHTSRKIKSRRSSAASYCSSYYSGVSKIKRRRRRRSFRFPCSSKVSTIDSKLLTEIDIITNTFATLCRIHHADKASPGGATLKEKEKPISETSSSSISKLPLLSSVGKRETRDKRSLKKRKLSENLDFALLAASVGGSGSSLTPSSGSTKRRHKKANSSSPDDHKLPLKKRHYLLTPGEKSTEAAAVAAKLFANNAEALAAVAAAAKSSASSLSAGSTSQQRLSTKNSKTAITPKKRHLLQTSMLADEGGGSLKGGSSHSSPLRISVETVAGVTNSKLLDISPALSTGSTTKPSTDAQVHKKRTRLEGLVTKIANHSDVQPLAGSVKLSSHTPQVDSENSSCPPPGVFEPTVELEIQIPPIAKLTEATAIITKSEVDSPLLLELNKTFPLPSTKIESGRVVEALLNKTGGNLLLKRKRKKINRTGFPTVRRKKRKINDQLLLDVTPDIIQQVEQSWSTPTTLGAVKPKASPAGLCDRVPHTGEASNTFVERENRAPPRLSVVSLDRLQGTTAKQDTIGSKRQQKRQERLQKEKTEGVFKTLDTPKNEIAKLSKVSDIDNKLDSRGSGGRRSLKAFKSSMPSRDKQTSKFQLSKSGALSVKKVEKTFTTPSTNGVMSKKELEVRRLLPAGIDPKINFSCKIRLKRRSSLHGIALAALKDSKASLIETINKDPHSEHLEHDVLPLSDGAGAESEAASDTSDEKSSAASTVGGRKNVRWKKTYLTAGLFSDYFKYLEPPTVISKKQQKKLSGNLKEAPPLNSAIVDSSALQQPLLPPPPYCEKYFRRTQLDFELPYDIWWAYKNAKLPARVTVPSWNYRKIRTNIYAESVRPNMAGFDHPTCNCKPDVGCGDDCLNRLVYTECSPSCCPTRDKCRNQKIQRHEVAPGVERFMTENKGWGVRTNLPIKKGTYILEYVGEVVTERDFKDRMGTIYLNDTHHYCLHLDGGLVIDGHRMGSDGRFVNHSCQPNCEMQKWSVNGLSRMALFAARNIVENEELTYDYNFSLFNPSEGQPCRCNTPQCRGVIGGKSQRIKPLPIIEVNPIETPAKEPVQKGRQRKRIAKKNSAFLQSKDVVFTQVQQLSEKEKKYVKQHAVFLLRNFEKIRKYKRERGSTKTLPHTGLKIQTQIPTPSPNTSSPATVTVRRASTPASFAAQISALRSHRNMKTRGLALANSDPEVEKLARMAVILRDICTALEMIKDPNDDKIYLTASVLSASTAAATISTNKKKKLAKPAIPATESPSSSLLLLQKEETLNFLTIQTNIEKGFYKQPTEFDADMQLIFKQATQSHVEDVAKLAALSILSETYAKQKQHYYKQLLEVASESACKAFLGISELTEIQSSSESPNTAKIEPEIAKIEAAKPTEDDPNENTSKKTHSSRKSVNASPIEDIIRCICGLYKDEGLMIQCARCMVWQHTECTKADINADNYHCERCEPREVSREIALEDFTEDGHRYYLSLLRGELHVRQGDTVYVLRDIPIKDEAGNIIPSKKHTYETIGEIDYSECDIFRVERLWKNNEGKRFIFGHHFLRPHETFHEPTRRFYPNEVVRVPLYEVVPIELVIGRCWVLDRTTFCKGRPIECEDDAHCYICELRVDRSARFFSKAKITYPACTKSYAFRKFPDKLKISKTYAPHDVDPAMLKTKKQKTDLELDSSSSTPALTARNEINKTPPVVRKRHSSSSPATGAGSNVPQSPGTVQVITPVAPPLQTIKAKRSHLENVLKAMKLRMQKNTQLTNEPPLDLSYLLSGRGARQRKTNASSSATLANVPT